MHGLFIIRGVFIGRRVARDAAGSGLFEFLVEHSDLEGIYLWTKALVAFHSIIQVLW